MEGQPMSLQVRVHKDYWNFMEENPEGISDFFEGFVRDMITVIELKRVDSNHPELDEDARNLMAVKNAVHMDGIVSKSAELKAVMARQVQQFFDLVKKINDAKDATHGMDARGN